METAIYNSVNPEHRGAFANKKKKVFFIKKLPSQDCCFEILSFAFYRENVETLMKLLSKEARNYLQENIDLIIRLKSHFSYTFTIGSAIDLRNLQHLDLSCSDFILQGFPKQQEEMMDTLNCLTLTKQNYPLSQLTHLKLSLEAIYSVHFLAYLSRIYQIKSMEITESKQQSLCLLLSLPNLCIDTLTMTLPCDGYNQVTGTQQQINNGILSNLTLRSLTLFFPYSIKDSNYSEFTRLLTSIPNSLTHLSLNLQYNCYESDAYLPKFFSSSLTNLRHFELLNALFPNKQSYIQLSSYIAQLPRCEVIRLQNCKFYDKMPATFYNYINIRWHHRLVELRIVDQIIDYNNIHAIAEVVKNNNQSLKTVEFSRFLKEKPKMLQLENLIGGLENVDQVIFRDSKIRFNPIIQAVFQKLISTKRSFQALELECDNYEDIFENISESLHFQRLVLITNEISKYSANKLFFELSLGRITVNTLQLSGGFNDSMIRKLPQIISKQSALTKLDISGNQLTGEGACAIREILLQSNQSSLKEININANRFGNKEINSIFSLNDQSEFRIKKIEFQQQLVELQPIVILKVIQSLSRMNQLDLSKYAIQDSHEAVLLQDYLMSPSSHYLRDFKLPKLHLQSLSLQQSCSCELFLSITQHPSLLTVYLPFLQPSLTYLELSYPQSDWQGLLVFKSVRIIYVSDMNINQSVTSLTPNLVKLMLEVNPLVCFTQIVEQPKLGKSKVLFTPKSTQGHQRNRSQFVFGNITNIVQNCEKVNMPNQKQVNHKGFKYNNSIQQKAQLSKNHH